MKLFFHEYKNLSTDYLIKFDNGQLFFLLKQLAANIIHDIKTEFSTKTILKSYCSWADHGYLNAFQSQVELLHNIIESIPQKTIDFNCSVQEKEIFLEALTLYQEWKTNFIKEEKIRMHCDNWGDATGFNKIDWTQDIKEKLQKEKGCGEKNRKNLQYQKIRSSTKKMFVTRKTM